MASAQVLAPSKGFISATWIQGGTEWTKRIVSILSKRRLRAQKCRPPGPGRVVANVSPARDARGRLSRPVLPGAEGQDAGCSILPMPGGVAQLGAPGDRSPLDPQWWSARLGRSPVRGTPGPTRTWRWRPRASCLHGLRGPGPVTPFHKPGAEHTVGVSYLTGVPRGLEWLNEARPRARKSQRRPCGSKSH